MVTTVQGRLIIWPKYGISDSLIRYIEKINMNHFANWQAIHNLRSTRSRINHHSARTRKYKYTIRLSFQPNVTWRGPRPRPFIDTIKESITTFLVNYPVIVFLIQQEDSAKVEHVRLQYTTAIHNCAHFSLSLTVSYVQFRRFCAWWAIKDIPFPYRNNIPWSPSWNYARQSTKLSMYADLSRGFLLTD